MDYRVAEIQHVIGSSTLSFFLNNMFQKNTEA